MTDTEQKRELNIDDLVTRLGKSRDWWKREVNEKNHPGLRVGRDLLFTEEDYLTIREHYRRAGVTPSDAPDADPLRSLSTRSRRKSTRK